MPSNRSPNRSPNRRSADGLPHGESATPPTERELTHPVTLCRADGTLNPQAIGWSRTPLHDAMLSGWGRNKRWDHWCVTADTHVLAITYSSIDYLAVLNVWFCDLETLQVASIELGSPGAFGVHLPDTVDGGEMTFSMLGRHIGIHPQAGGTRLTASGKTWQGVQIDAEVFVELPEGHETLSVVVPWSKRRFQYTSKHNTRPATGTVTVDGREYRFGPENHAYGALDFGRGRWPHKVAWNWGGASGVSDGHVVGLQLGGKWTRGTGVTENALCIDGRIHKISEELDWNYNPAAWSTPWRVTTPNRVDGAPRVDLAFTPAHQRHVKVSIGVLGNETHQCFGRWSGSVAIASDREIGIDHLVGWAEDIAMIW